MRTSLSNGLVFTVLLGFAGTATGAPIPLAQYPLFLSSSVTPNVLVIYDNSQSMDALMSGKIINGNDPNTRGNIARQALRQVINNYRTAFRWGLMTFELAGSPRKWFTYPYYLGNPGTMEFTDDCTGIGPDGIGTSASHGGLRCLANPQPFPGGNYVTFARASDDVDILDVLYTSTNFGSSLWLIPNSAAPTERSYRAYSTHNPGGGWAAANFSSSVGTLAFCPTDAGFTTTPYGAPDACGFTAAPFQRQLNLLRGWGYISPSGVTGRGTLLEAVQNDSTAHFNTLMTLLGPETESPATTPGTPTSAEIKNAATFTPLEGSLISAKNYFSGGSTPIQASCQKNFVVLATDGMPTAKTNGDMWPLSDQGGSYNPATGTWSWRPAVQGVLDAITSLRSVSVGGTPFDINTYVVALGDSVANATAVAAMNAMAQAGGTSNAFFASDPTALNNAFSTIAQDITSRTGAASAVTLNTGTWNAGAFVYQARFNSGDWSGQLLAYSVGAGGALATTPTWDAGQVVNTQNWDTGRQILTYKPSAAFGSRGIPFRWPANPASPGPTELDSAQTTWLNKNMAGTVDGYGQLRLKYIRGDDSQECLTCSPRFRPRPTSKLGDIATSSPVYVGPPPFAYPPTLESVDYATFYSARASRTPVLYVGANDGMLHAFDANSGRELFAYIPTAVYKNFGAFTDPAYSHRYFVDGTPTVGDVFYGGAWHTVLVGSLRGGGQGIFALDITDPGTFSEANASNIVRWEFTDANDSDLGYTYGQAIIVKVRTGASTSAWAAIFGNGYNNTEADGAASTTGHAVLYVVNIENGQLIAKITTKTGSTTTPNGLATPAAIDVDGDYIVDYVYAGDLQGNLWKFDLTANNPSTWKSAFMSGSTPQPLFSTGAANRPIMVRPDVAKHPQGGYLVTFGTGSYIATGDNTTTYVQAIYGIWDKNTGSSSDKVSPSDLVQQSIIGTYTGPDGNTYRRTTHAVGVPTDATFTGDNTISTSAYYAGKKGWFMELPQYGPGAIAERVVSDPVIRAGRSIFATVIPSTVLCSYGGDGWIQEFDIYTGNRITSGVFDVNRDGLITSADMIAGGHVSGRKIAGIPMMPGFLRDRLQPGINPTENKYVNTSAGNVESVKETGGNVRQGRTSWVEIFKD